MDVVEYDRYGDASVLHVRHRPIPTATRGHVVVRVKAAALNPKDVLARAGKFPWLAGRTFPKRLGYDWSGEVVEVGPGCGGLRVGDALFGMIQSWSAGACGEYVRVRADELAPKPSGLSWEEAAALPLVGLTALQALRDHGKLTRGQRVLLNGASGGVGVHAIQIAKALGAHVTTLTSAANCELALSLGADDALDYARWTPGGTFDIVFDIFGNRPFASMRHVLTDRGRYISTVPKLANLVAAARSIVSRQRAFVVVVRSKRKDLEVLSELVARGALRPIVDRVFPLADVVNASKFIETKRARGKVVLRVTP